MESVLITHKNLNDKFSDQLYEPIREVINKIQPKNDRIKNTWVPKTLQILEPTDKIIHLDKKFKTILVKGKFYQPIPQKLAHKLKTNQIQKIVYQIGELKNNNTFLKGKYQVLPIRHSSSNHFRQNLQKIEKCPQKQQKFNLFSSLDLPFNFLFSKNNEGFNLSDMKNEIIAKQNNP